MQIRRAQRDWTHGPFPDDPRFHGSCAGRPRPPGRFASIADWDPGVTEARLISGEPGAVGAQYALLVPFGPRRLHLEYEIVERQEPADNRPGWVTLVAEAGTFSSRDTITVRPGAIGAQVDYHAELTLHGPGRILDLPMHLAFQVIGRRAEAGLRQELARLGAHDVSEPAA